MNTHNRVARELEVIRKLYPDGCEREGIIVAGTASLQYSEYLEALHNQNPNGELATQRLMASRIARANSYLLEYRLAELSGESPERELWEAAKNDLGFVDNMNETRYTPEALKALEKEVGKSE